MDHRFISPSAARAAMWFAFALAVSGCATSRAPKDALFESFSRPTKDTRPFVRWWWNGGRVSSGEIVRQLAVMDIAGIGGVEINTIADPGGAPEAVLARFPPRPWLSPEWNEAVRVAAEAARERGMTTDIIVGSGWPFGARFLAPEEQIQRVFLVRRELEGPLLLETTVDELAEGPDEFWQRHGSEHPRNSPVPTARRLLDLRLVPAPGRIFDPGVTGLAGLPADATGPRASVRLQIPAGKHVVYAVLWEAGFSHVKLGAPGADGPVVDHYNARAVRRYLDHMSSALAPALGGRLGGALRAAFVDSLELDHANWTSDLPDEFRRRRGYDLALYLPFVLESDDPTVDTERTAIIRRARYDFFLTLIELFEERFIRTYIAWAQDNGLRARIQAYGRETHPLHGSMEVHLPEGETWLWHDKERPERITVESTVINRYVASAANLTGQRLRSFEAMTNAVPVFRETLQDFKRGLDATLISGLNHPILHGFNYTPREAGFPGWVRFGSYLNERTPFWPMFRRFSDYAARLGTVLRRSEFVARIAVLAPRAEEWQHYGLLYQPFPEVHHPFYQYHLTDAIAQSGWGSDYVSERIVQRGRMEDGALKYGSRRYDVLILQEVNAVEPATATALRRFAEAGGRLVFIGQAPSRAPGLLEHEARDQIVRAELYAALRAAGARALVVPPPKERSLLAWTEHLLRETNVPPSVHIQPTRPHLAQIHHLEKTGRGERHFFFFVNSHTDEPAVFQAVFPGQRGTPWRWDPETGTRTPLALSPGAASNGPPSLSLYLPALGAILVVFEPTPPAGSHQDAANARPPELVFTDPAHGLASAREVLGPWQIELRPADGAPPFFREGQALGDLSLVADDPALSGFAGLAIYRTQFDATSADAVLDLGTVHGTSELWVNGQPAGAGWWGPRRHAVGHLLRPGKNTLEVRVATVLANYMKAQKDNPEAQRWAFWFKPIPMGLVGPVRIAARSPDGN